MKFKLLTTLTIVMSALSLQGCINSLGKEEFSCPNLKKGGVCGGPRDVYKLTNNRVSLENLTQEELDAYRNGQNNQTVSLYESDGETKQVVGSTGEKTQLKNKTTDRGLSDNSVTYAARGDGQQTPDNYQTPEVLPQTRFSYQQNKYEQWPSNSEPLAPEPLATLEPAQVMRVLIASYTDSDGLLHMPGYTFVEVTPRRWNYGEAANERPSRVVPLEVKRRSEEQFNRARNRSNGVDAMEVVNPMNRTK
ncbi:MULTISPECIES: TraV family lipoprotein [unclassified Pseudoalteromonas]|uniref:TraV family lipoprotein n=1 Tax=unclassified Pseudoalteromonas TaxID=194690 RepID=UPI0023597429|nr:MULTISPECIES: TraV family lipoprotein [unclassified Pseudoalteromonas]MDC9563433.1 TraV family lipoprotein [Pseudoalteromonas sp. GAB2316C]MDC9572085.1 TraV family lipoprotein [Pseudoalteromonas sp. GABNS16A]MDC9583880.1 TraV family lipoprotein [Pseudoalteromonas sp. GABNS16C]MDC9607851.1 TraV family lipoprotein [Pseudoalteromonas sp. GABNS16H]